MMLCKVPLRRGNGMALSSSFSSLLLLSLVVFGWTTTVVTATSKCGKWYSSPCLADDDVRYDESYTNNILDQNPIWSKRVGYWIHKVQAYDAQGLPYTPRHTDPNDPSATPYEAFYQRGHSNFTIVGSRAYYNQYHVRPPARQEFCNKPIPEGSKNVIGPPDIVECGVTGFNFFSTSYYTSTYEKDGSLISLESTVSVQGTTNDDGKEIRRAKVVVPDDKTILETIPVKIGFQVRSWVFLNSDYTLATQSLEIYKETDTMTVLLRRNIDTIHKVTKDKWLQEIETAYEDANVPKEIRIQNGQLPMITECLDDNCPTEEEWCTTDPNCSTSPYIEPDATIKAGPIAGIIVAIFVVVFVGMVLFFQHLLNQQKERYRTVFASRVAETIQLNKTDSKLMLTPEALAKEFQKIDSGLTDGGDGVISKEELWTFISSGKAGNSMNRKDFDALFVAMDVDNNGSVDFLEFCNFMSMCGKQFDDARRKNAMTRKSLNWNNVSRRLLVPMDDTEKQQDDIDEEVAA